VVVVQGLRRPLLPNEMPEGAEGAPLVMHDKVCQQ
jgi:hypothetical protein